MFVVLAGVLLQRAYIKVARATHVPGFHTAGTWYLFSCILTAMFIGIPLFLFVAPFVAGRAFAALRDRADDADAGADTPQPPAA